jgi:hypothetical protein
MKIKFFHFVRYFLVSCTRYELLTWLLEQPTGFIKTFLAFSTIKVIDTDVEIEIPFSNAAPLQFYYFALVWIIPIFKFNLIENQLEITIREEIIHKWYPSLKALSIHDLKYFLTRIIQKLSK